MNSREGRDIVSPDRLFPSALLIVIILLWWIPHAVSGEKIIKNLHDTRIIKSSEKPHDILNEACYACHPKDDFDFWILIYDKEPRLTIEKEMAPPIPSGSSSKEVKDSFNSHDGLGCKFCHYENPTEKSPKFIVEVGDLCKVCHPATTIHNLPGDNKRSENIRGLIKNGKLPGSAGEINCLTCHSIHDSVFSMRIDYARSLAAGRVPDPHGSRLYCHRCHPGKIRMKGDLRFVTGSDLDSLCQRCHEKEGVPDSPHIWAVSSSEKTWKMDYLGYPLRRGKLTCQSCHDEICYGERDRDNPKFVRGGPYRDIDDFCYKCHMNTGVAFTSPHRQIDQFGRIIEESCLFCHQGVPAVNGEGKTGISGDEVGICGACHDIVPHPGVNHLLRLPDNMKKRKIEYEKKHFVMIPVGDDYRIRCSTCHNPHSKGVLKGEAGVGAGSKWRVADFKEVCAPCHGRY